MLILTRKVGETIRIGDTVTVRVLEVRGGQVRLGLEAPADVRILREEIYRSEPAAAVDGNQTSGPVDARGMKPPAA